MVRNRDDHLSLSLNLHHDQLTSSRETIRSDGQYRLHPTLDSRWLPTLCKDSLGDTRELGRRWGVKASMDYHLDFFFFFFEKFAHFV